MPFLFGKQLAQTVQSQLKTYIQDHQLQPKLAVLLVGDDPASALYVSLKMKAAAEIGVQVKMKQTTEATTTAEAQQIVQDWNDDPTIHGILVQLPLPEQLDTQTIINTMDPKKDVDGFHPTNIQALMDGKATVISPVHEGILRLLAQSPLVINAAKVVILANSVIFADPLAKLLKTAGAFVTNMSPETIDKQKLATADVVVIAIGRARFLNPTMTKNGAVLIDVGTNRNETGHVCGDVDTEAYINQPETYISAVPGGIGPLTIAHLLKNTITACERQMLGADNASA